MNKTEEIKNGTTNTMTIEEQPKGDDSLLTDNSKLTEYSQQILLF